ncbi:MAG TPA: SGNH/GDSL hydrolase family protein [Burkholderiales bacterium]|nr:SGNH/GDSL hydrolase family protein [Burkholderiales bacterium]
MATQADLRSELQLLAGRRIYFGHQSVGANLLDGVQTLAAEHAVAMPVNEVPQARAIEAGGFSHVFVAENGDPLRKLGSFAAALGEEAPVDVALLKFCYVDVKARTDVQALFARYREAVDMMRAKNPRTVFVHVTVPLTVAQAGLKALAKRVLGRVPDNVRREEYNELMRRTYAAREPIFDLARLQSVSPNETRGADGGHLNAEGRRYLARQLIGVLATAARPLQKIDDSATPARFPR